MVILISGSLWILMSLFVSNIEIQYLREIIFLVLIGDLRWRSTSVVGFRCHTGIYYLHHFYILPRNQKLLLEY